MYLGKWPQRTVKTITTQTKSLHQIGSSNEFFFFYSIRVIFFSLFLRIPKKQQRAVDFRRTRIKLFNVYLSKYSDETKGRRRESTHSYARSNCAREMHSCCVAAATSPSDRDSGWRARATGTALCGAGSCRALRNRCRAIATNSFSFFFRQLFECVRCYYTSVAAASCRLPTFVPNECCGHRTLMYELLSECLPRTESARTHTRAHEREVGDLGACFMPV